jgi:hypothetical protein
MLAKSKNMLQLLFLIRLQTRVLGGFLNCIMLGILGPFGALDNVVMLTIDPICIVLASV